jgi:hypothetical protein
VAALVAGFGVVAVWARATQVNKVRLRTVRIFLRNFEL